MIQNLQEELYQLENKQPNSATHFVLTLDGMWRAKNAPKLSSEYLVHGSGPNQYQIGNKTCYITKVSKFFVEKICLC